MLTVSPGASALRETGAVARRGASHRTEAIDGEEEATREVCLDGE